MQRPDQRYTAGEFSDYQINQYFDVYSSLMFMDDHSVGAIAPSGSFFGDEIFNIPCNDPLLSAAQANTICGASAVRPAPERRRLEIGRRNVEGGPRTADLEHMDFRFQLGVKGDLGDGWQYDLMGQYGRAVLTEAQGGYFLNSKLLNALDVVTDTRAGSPTLGQPVCESVISGSDTACVPYNIWSPNGVTPAALQYLTGLAENSGSTTEQIINLNFDNPDLSKYGLKSPAANAGAGFSGGFEYRAEGLQTIYDAAIASGDLAGFGGGLKNTQGNQIDEDLYAELRVPLIQDMTFAKDVEFETGFRWADYEHGGSDITYKFGLDWQTTDDLRLRASYERAVRAPNVEELFQPATPRACSPAPTAAPGLGGDRVLTAAQCLNTFQHTLPGITLNQLLNGGYTVDGHHPRSALRQHSHRPVRRGPVRRVLRRQPAPAPGNRRHLFGGLRANPEVHQELHADSRLLEHQRRSGYHPGPGHHYRYQLR